MKLVKFLFIFIFFSLYKIDINYILMFKKNLKYLLKINIRVYRLIRGMIGKYKNLWISIIQSFNSLHLKKYRVFQYRVRNSKCQFGHSVIH